MDERERQPERERPREGQPERELERERLQRIAYGPDSSAEDAAEAVLALGRLERRPAGAAVAGSAAPSGSAAAAGSATAATAAGSAPDQGPAGVDVGGTAAASAGPPVATTDGSGPADRSGSSGRSTSVVRTVLLHPVALAAGTAVVAFVLGGLATNLLRTEPPAADGPKSSVAEQTSLARILPRSQTDADRLPAALRSDVQPDTARLLFANGADSPSTPWEAWVVRRTDGELCFIASPDRRTATSSCVPASVAFGSSVSLVARAQSDVLTVHVDRGGVDVVLVGRN